MFSYSGPITLTGPDGIGKVVKITHSHLVSTLDCDATPWRGTARVPGLIYGLLDVLGGTVRVTLPDGRTGKAYATGWSEESVWVIELQGVGTPPE